MHRDDPSSIREAVMNATWNEAACERPDPYLEWGMPDPAGFSKGTRTVVLRPYSGHCDRRRLSDESSPTAACGRIRQFAGRPGEASLSDNSHDRRRVQTFEGSDQGNKRG